jgi:hypothetical protein
MSREFERVRESARSSRLGQAADVTIRAVAAAARSSRSGALLRRLRHEFRASSPSRQWRCVALAIAVAAAVHFVLRAFMPATVIPALPLTFLIGVAALATLIAWQPEAFHRAWRSSRLPRLFR